MTADLTREKLAARGLRVKPLEWVDEGADDWSAHCPIFGDLYVLSSKSRDDISAKREARILAALEDTGEPALIREAEARVENAVRGYFGRTIDRHRSLAGVLEAIRGETP